MAPRHVTPMYQPPGWRCVHCKARWVNPKTEHDRIVQICDPPHPSICSECRAKGLPFDPYEHPIPPRAAD